MSDNISYIDQRKKKYRINVGIILFGVAFLYIIATILIYLTSDHVTIYEVREGSLYRDTSYTGFIVRNETVVNADESGYVNYFATDGSKVGLRTRVYTSSDKELEFNTDQSAEVNAFSDEDLDSLYNKVNDTATGFNNDSFDDVYTLKSTITDAVDNKSSMSRTSQIDNMLASGMQGLNVYNAPVPGVVSYSIDGYENIKSGSVTKDIINKDDYSRVTLDNNEKVSAGDSVYKVITNDVWTVVILLDDETAKELKDKSSVSVKFPKDNTTATAGIEIKKRDNNNYAYLSFNQGMVRYFKDRYIDVELILQNVSGLKIPKSSVVKKNFYEVPEEYLTQGGNTKNTGVLVDTGKDDPTFVSLSIYARDEDSGTVYLDPSAFKDIGKTLIKPESNETFDLSSKKELEGVYNINKGYAVFRKIEIQAKNDDYCIVSTGSDYGLSNYDHIALDGSLIDENDVVF